MVNDWIWYVVLDKVVYYFNDDDDDEDEDDYDNDDDDILSLKTHRPLF